MGGNVDINWEDDWGFNPPARQPVDKTPQTEPTYTVFHVPHGSNPARTAANQARAVDAINIVGGVVSHAGDEQIIMVPADRAREFGSRLFTAGILYYTTGTVAKAEIDQKKYFWTFGGV